MGYRIVCLAGGGLYGAGSLRWAPTRTRAISAIPRKGESLVLIIRGLGGSGKSELLSEFKKQTPRDTCVVTLDFAQKSLREDDLTFLENLSQQVEPYCDAEGTVEFRKSIATGRYEIGKRFASSHTEGGFDPPAPRPTNPLMPGKAVEIFYSYARKDERLKKELEIHLGHLKQEGLITGWYDREIHAGAEWASEIDAHLNSAHIILLLVSSNFVASEYCYGVEMKRALKRHESQEARVIPIILRPTDWEGAPFSKLQVLPKDGQAVTESANRDRAFLDIARGIRRVVDELNAQVAESTSTQRPEQVDRSDKGQQSVAPGSDVDIQETRRQMREIAREKLYAQMKTFRMKRLVVMLDTCEWLNERTAEAARWAGTELIKGLRERMQDQGKACFVVMTSRLPLKLEGINEVEQKQLRLKMLDRTDVNQYLESMGTYDPTIQDYIYNMTYGHPHSIAIIHKIFEEQWDRPITAAVSDLHKLQGQFYERAMQDVIGSDVLERLLKSPLDALTWYGVLLHRFNLPLLQAVFQEWLPGPEASSLFNELIRYPHVESLGGFYYVFHKLLREILAGYIWVNEPEKWRKYHKLALDFLTQKGESSQPLTYSPDSYYHLLAYDEKKGVSYWNDIKTHAPPEYIDELREAARDKTLQLTLATMQCMGILRDTLNGAA